MRMSDPTPEQVLAVRLDPNDSGADTIRGYLVALLRELWREGEGFSGKHPFGNSDWEYDLYQPLVRDGLVAGRMDEDGCLVEADDGAARALIEAAIDALL